MPPPEGWRDLSAVGDVCARRRACRPPQAGHSLHRLDNPAVRAFPPITLNPTIVARPPVGLLRPLRWLEARPPALPPLAAQIFPEGECPPFTR